MAEIPTGGNNHEVLKAEEFLRNPDVVWHSVNGFDFGAVLGILKGGISTSRQLGNHQAVSLVSSPADKTVANHRLFDSYTARAISFPLFESQLDRRTSSINSTDEIQYPFPIDRDRLLGIMFPQGLADSPVADLPILKPPTASKFESFMSHQINALLEVDQQSLSEEDIDKLTKLRDMFATQYSFYAKRKHLAGVINHFLLSKYQTVFEHVIGVNNPTLHDVVKYLADKNHLEVLAFPADFKVDQNNGDS